MANEIDSIVSVTIDAQTTTPIGLDFGTMLIASGEAAFAERVRTYTSMQGVLADFATTTATYRAAQAVFSQNPRLPALKIGRLTVGSAMIVTLTPVNLVSLRVYTLTINGQVFTFTADASAVAAEIVAGFITVINAAAMGITASGTATLILTATVAGKPFRVESNSDFTSQNTTPDTSGIAAQIAAIQAEDDNWYGFMMTSWGKAEITAAAAYIETQKKIAVFTTNDADVLAVGSGDIASALVALNYERSSLWFSRNPHQYLGGAIMGLMLGQQPGSNTWKFKTVAGVALDTFSPSELTRLKAKRANYYISIAGTGNTTEGITPVGEFIDINIFVDWLQNDMQIAIFSALKSLPKVPMTDAGITVVRNAIQGSLKRGIEAKGIDDTDLSLIVINVPKARSLSQSDRNNRRLTGVSFSAPLAGAIHYVTVTGSLV